MLQLKSKMADFDTISISSDDSEAPFMDGDISQDTHKVFLIENEQKHFLIDKDPFSLEEELNEHVEVKTEVLVSFASIDSIKKEVEGGLDYNENSIENPEESEEMVSNMNEIEYNLCSDRSFYEPRDIIGSYRQQEIYNENLEQRSQIEECSDLVIHLDSDDCEDSEMSHSSMMLLLAKGLADTLGNDEPSTAPAGNANDIDLRDRAILNNLTEGNMDINQNVQSCSDIIDRTQKTMKGQQKSKKLLNLENTIFNVSIGNYSVTSEDIDAVRKSKTTHNFFKVLTKRLEKARCKKVMMERAMEFSMKANSSIVDNNTCDVIPGRSSNNNSMTTIPMELTSHLLNEQEVKHNRISESFKESDVRSNHNRQNDTKSYQNDTARQHKRKKRKHNKSPHRKVKENINKMKKDLLKTIQEELKEFNSNLDRLTREYENRDRINSSDLEKSSTEAKRRKRSSSNSSSFPRSSSANKPLLEKLKLSIDKNSGSISVAVVPPPKPMGACKPIQRDSPTKPGSTSSKTVSSPDEIEFSYIHGANTQLGNETAIVTNGIQDLSDTLIYPMNDKLFRAKFVKCYGLVFDSHGQRICTEMGDLLLISLKEYRTFIKRLEMAKKLSCDQRQIETSCALKSYNNSANRYIISFESLFKEIHRKICENQTIIDLGQCKTLLIAWFLKIFLRAANISPELSDSLEEVKHHMLTELFRNVKQKIPVVHETFGTNSTRFQQDCWQALDLMKDVYEEDEESVREQSPADILNDVTVQNQGELLSRSNTLESEAVDVSQDGSSNVNVQTLQVVHSSASSSSSTKDNQYTISKSSSQPQDSSLNIIVQTQDSSASSSNSTINNVYSTSKCSSQPQGSSLLNGSVQKQNSSASSSNSTRKNQYSSSKFSSQPQDSSLLNGCVQTQNSSASSSNFTINNQFITNTTGGPSQVSLEPPSKNNNRINYRDHIQNMSLGSPRTCPKILKKLTTNPPQKPRNAAHQMPKVISSQPSWKDHNFFNSTEQSQNVSSKMEDNEAILTLEQLLTPTSTLTSYYFKSQQVFLPLENSAKSSQQQLYGSKTKVHEQNNGALASARQQVPKENRTHKLLNSSDVTIRLSQNKVSKQVSVKNASSGLSPAPESNASVSSAATSNLVNNSLTHSGVGLNSVTPGSFQNNETTEVIHRLLANSHPSVTLHYRPAQ